MPSTYRYIHSSFWDDDFIQTITPEDKYFYLYAMTNPHTSQCGIYAITKRTMAFETGYNQETIDKLLKRFTDYKRILYNPANSELFIVNWLKHNGTRSPKVIRHVEEELKEIKTDLYRNMAIKTCLKMEYPIDTVSLGYCEIEIEIEIENKNEIEIEKEKPVLKTTKPERLKFGEYKNVLLTQDEYDRLKAELNSSLDTLINSMSTWLKAHGKTYKDYAAALRNWSRRDNGNNAQSQGITGSPQKKDLSAGLGGPAGFIHRP